MPSRGRRTNVALTAFLWAGNRKQVSTGRNNRVGSGKEERGKSDSLWPLPVHLGKPLNPAVPPLNTLNSRGWMGALFISLSFALFLLFSPISEDRSPQILSLQVWWVRSPRILSLQVWQVISHTSGRSDQCPAQLRPLCAHHGIFICSGNTFCNTCLPNSAAQGLS